MYRLFILACCVVVWSTASVGCVSEVADEPPPHLYEEYLQAEVDMVSAHCDASDRLECLSFIQRPVPEDCEYVRGPRPVLGDEDRCIMTAIDAHWTQIEPAFRCTIDVLRALQRCFDGVMHCSEDTSAELERCSEMATNRDCGELPVEYVSALDGCFPEHGH